MTRTTSAKRMVDSSTAPPTDSIPGHQRVLISPSLLVCLALGVVTFACYWHVQHFPFSTFDDPEYVDHLRIVGGPTWDNIVWAFTSVHFANWHPLTSISFMIDRQLWGLNPRPYHLENIILHVANTLLLFVVM